MAVECYNTSQSRNRILLIAGVLGTACGLSYLWYSHTQNNITATARITTANEQLERVVTTVTEWIATNPTDHTNDAAIEIEKQLVDALVNPFVTDRQSAEDVLTRLRQTREDVLNRDQQREIKRLLARKLVPEADELLKDAKTLIEQKDVLAAIVRLREYVDHAKATEVVEARRLLNEVEYSISDIRAYETLILLDDADFVQLIITHSMIDPDITHPSLVDVHNNTVQRNIERAAQRRQELWELAEARRTIDDLTATQRQYSERAKAKTIETEASLVYLSKGYARIEMRIQQTDTALRNIARSLISSQQNYNAPWSGPNTIRTGIIDPKGLGALMSSDGLVLTDALKELKRQDFSPDLAAMHSVFIAYVESTRDAVVAYGDVLQNTTLSGRSTSPESVTSFGNALLDWSRSRKAWENKWRQTSSQYPNAAIEPSWEQYVKRFNEKQ